MEAHQEIHRLSDPQQETYTLICSCGHEITEEKEEHAIEKLEQHIKLKLTEERN